MLTHLLVSSPQGPCFVHRSYDPSKLLDPQVVSGLVAAQESSGARLMNIASILREEMNNPIDVKIQVKKHYNYISTAITTGKTDTTQLTNALEQISQLTYEAFGNPQRVIALDIDKIKTVERKIDIILTKAGLMG